MKIYALKIYTTIITLSLFQLAFCQEPSQKSEFWKKVQFGGGLGLGFGNNSTNISVAPSAIYNFNEKVALGLGIQYSYIRQKDFYTSHLYGGSIIGLVNPIPEVQLSAELEELRVNTDFEDSNLNTDNFWNTALFLGAGYRTNNATIGIRYNVLHKDRNNIYTTAFMPFVRVYF
jgi:opacity protein-like surface antigen